MQKQQSAFISIDAHKHTHIAAGSRAIKAAYFRRLWNLAGLLASPYHPYHIKKTKPVALNVLCIHRKLV